MEAYGGVLVDQGVYTKRSNSAVHVFSSTCNNNNNNGFFRRLASQELLSCHIPGAGAVFSGTRPPLCASSPLPAPTHRSLPPPHLLQQPCPPLLPLPLSRSFSLPSPIPQVSTRRVIGAAAVRSANKDQKKRRSSHANTTKGPRSGAARPQKAPPAAASPPGRVRKSAAVTNCPFKDAAAKEGGDFTGDVYALSPPPSSLPMPRFSLRVRTPSSSSTSSSCDPETLGGVVPVGGGVGAGASDDLRQLLRL